MKNTLKYKIVFSFLIISFYNCTSVNTDTAVEINKHVVQILNDMRVNPVAYFKLSYDKQGLYDYDSIEDRKKLHREIRSSLKDPTVINQSSRYVDSSVIRNAYHKEILDIKRMIFNPSLMLGDLWNDGENKITEQGKKFQEAIQKLDPKDSKITAFITSMNNPATLTAIVTKLKTVPALMGSIVVKDKDKKDITPRALTDEEFTIFAKVIISDAKNSLYAIDTLPIDRTLGYFVHDGHVYPPTPYLHYIAIQRYVTFISEAGTWNHYENGVSSEHSSESGYAYWGENLCAGGYDKDKKPLELAYFGIMCLMSSPDGHRELMLGADEAGMAFGVTYNRKVYAGLSLINRKKPIYYGDPKP